MTTKTVRGSFRNWMFTINNPIVNDLPDRFANNCEFITWQLERGEKGTPHLQGYMVLKANPANKNGRTKKWVLDNIAPMGCYFEPRNGSHEQAVHYCNKPIEGCKCKHCEPKPVRLAGPWTVGKWDEVESARHAAGGRAAGAVHKRTVEDLLGDIKGGASDREVLDKYPRLAMSMTKGIERARLILSQDHPRVQPYCVVFHGPTGTGKSHRAAEIMKNNGGGFIFRKGNSGNMWADGYDPLRHPVVVYEEMDGGFMPYRQLLRICDKWQLTLDTKGGAVNFCPKIVIFTSNKHPKDWYSQETVPDTTELMRRLTGAYGAIIEMKTPFVQPQLDEPDLADVIDLLETGELVDQVAHIIDITDDDDISEQVFEQHQPVDHTPPDAWQGGDDREVGDDTVVDYSEYDAERDYNQGFDERWPQHRPNTRVAPPPLRRTDTAAAAFAIIKPPKASDAEFRKHKQIPGQSKLAVISKTSASTSTHVDPDADLDDK